MSESFKTHLDSAEHLGVFQASDDHPKDQHSGVVYRIPCASCPASYISQTGCRLYQHIEEHKQAVSQADFNSSALADHAWTLEHLIDWSNVEVLANPREYRMARKFSRIGRWQRFCEKIFTVRRSQSTKHDNHKISRLKFSRSEANP